MFIDDFDYHHHLFITYNTLQQSYAQYPTLFYLNPILIHGNVIKTKMDLAIIIISP